MLTRCPACQTVFRLGAGELARRGGEVRCGYCYQAFNALEHEIQSPQSTRARSAEAASRPAPATPAFFLLEESSPAADIAPGADGEADADVAILPEAAADAETGAAEEAGASAAESVAAAHITTDTETAPAAETASTENAIAATVLPSAHFLITAAKDDDETFLSPAPPPVLPEVMRSGRQTVSISAEVDAGAASGCADDGASAAHEDGFGHAATLADAGQLRSDSSADAETAFHPAQAAPDAEPDAADTAFDALDARYGRPPAPGSKAARVLVNLLLAALGLVLAGQLTYLFRHELARQLPGLRPLLEAGCSHLGCEVQWPQQAQLLSLEASDLHSVPGQPERYLLDLTLSNRAQYAQAWPHLELTLTDTRDQVLVRRVLSPHEWMPAHEGAPSFAAYRSISTRIPFAAPELAPTGYRVYVFYP